MFGEFFRFEVRYWLRGVMVYVFLAIVTLLFGLATGSDNVQVGGAIGNTLRNAPYVIQQYYAIAGVLTALMVAAIYDSSASRDFSFKMADIVFSKPIRKWNYLLGRFSAATLIALIPTLGISLGIILAGLTVGLGNDRWGPIHWQAHLVSIGLFALPNTLLFGSVVYAIAVWTRNSMYSFLGVLLLIVGYGIGQTMISSLDNEFLAVTLDPMGIAPFAIATKYWTPDQRNHWVVSLTGYMLYNRALWIGIASIVFAIAAHNFSFDIKAERKRKKVKSNTAVGDSLLDSLTVAPTAFAIPKVDPKPRWSQQFLSTFFSDLRGIIKTPVFIVIVIAAMLNSGVSIIANATEGYGLTSFPVTYKMVEMIQGSFLAFLIAIITYFAGVMVWRDRDSRMSEIVGATPVPNSVFVASRMLTMSVVLTCLMLANIGLSCLVQLYHGYTRIQLDVYFTQLIVIEGLRFGFLTVLAMLAHTLAPNKYIGYFGFIIYLILNAFMWQFLRIDTLLVRFGRLPTYVYSDMFGHAPYTESMTGFALYWIAFSGILLWVCAMALHRGIPTALRVRFAQEARASSTTSRAFVALATVATLVSGGWLYYNTQILNTFIGSKEAEIRRIKYEEVYSKFANAPQPKIVDVKYEIDIFPETRNVKMLGTQVIANKSDQPIDTFYVNVAPTFETTMQIPNATLEKDDKDMGVRVFKMQPAMQPGESIEMKFTVESKTRGIENQVSNPELVQNGTFFNNSITPHFGFNPDRRVIDPVIRKKYKLEEVNTVPELTRECGPECQFHYIGQDSDWVNVETVISTSSDQTAVAPGSLVEKWTANNRNYYRYRLDHPSLNFYSFISAKYEVARSKRGDVDIEVYHHAEHPWNVPRMSQAIGDALDYCTKNYGPYKHKQARIIEFPRVASFAQAFPGTMPYSESIGFIAKLEKPDDIDMVYYIVSHEIAHQWWAHQVIGARMQGATLLSETLAQYSALMIMRKEYGPDMMHKFLRYEMDSYLRSRGTERMKERPLISVDPGQGYIHYRKGSAALYYLAEMIGEERINAVLKEIIDTYAYKGPPYPTSHILVDRLRAQTPPELQYLITDLFEDITLFANRTTEATCTELPDGKFAVKLKIECEKYKATDKGAESKVPMNDWIEIGAFAKPEPGKRYGKLLHRERVQLTDGVHEQEFVVDEKPYQAGVDPRNFLIDRMPDDNLKTVTLTTSK